AVILVEAGPDPVGSGRELELVTHVGGGPLNGIARGKRRAHLYSVERSAPSEVCERAHEIAARFAAEGRAVIGEGKRHPSPSPKRACDLDDRHAGGDRRSAIRDRHGERAEAVALGQHPGPGRMMEQGRLRVARDEVAPGAIAQLDKCHREALCPDASGAAIASPAGRAVRRRHARASAAGASTRAGSGSAAARIANPVRPRIALVSTCGSSIVSTKVLARPKSIGHCRVRRATTEAMGRPSRQSAAYESRAWPAPGMSSWTMIKDGSRSAAASSYRAISDSRSSTRQA